VTIKITVDNAAVNRAIAALRERTNDLSPAFAEIGEYYVRRVDRRFEQWSACWSGCRKICSRKRGVRSAIALIKKNGDKF
jgi:hypothetical protein